MGTSTFMDGFPIWVDSVSVIEIFFGEECLPKVHQDNLPHFLKALTVS
jgi:hypothetical protein